MNGLASNLVYDVTQDADGYMWMATINGLQRYDGNSFITFKYHDKQLGSLPNLAVNYMYVDKKGRLWLSFDHNHIGIFDTRKFVYQNIPIQKDTNLIFSGQHFVETIAGDLLLIKHSRSLWKYDEQKHAFVTAENVLPIPQNWHPDNIYWDKPLK